MLFQRLSRWLRETFRSGREKEKRADDRYTVRFPKDIWELDDSYKNLMRELAKR